MIRRAVLLLAIGASGCFSPDLDGRLCAAGDCPLDHLCVDGRCVAPWNEPDPEPTCGTPDALRDDFEAEGEPGPAWDVFPADTEPQPEQREGALVIQLDQNVGSAGYRSFGAARFEDAVAWVEVEVSTEPDHFSGIDLSASDLDRIGLFHRNGRLTAFVEREGVMAASAEVTYDPELHRYWRLLEHDGDTLFQVGPDGDKWYTIAQEETPAFAAAVLVELYGMSEGNAAAAQASVRFQSFGGESSPGWCAADSYRDDFGDNDTDSRWQKIDDGCAVSENNGSVILNSGASVQGYCGYFTRARFSLRDSAITIWTESLDDSPAGISSFLTAIDYNENALSLTHHDLEDLTASSGMGRTYNSDVHVYWQIAEENGEVVWRTSNDGSHWDDIGGVNTSDTGVDIDNLQIGFGRTIEPGSEMGGDFVVKEFN